MKTILMVLSLFFLNFCFAQDETTTKSWLHSLENIKDTELQIKAIKSYITSDNFYLPDSLAKNEKKYHDGMPRKHSCKIYFYVERNKKTQ